MRVSALEQLPEHLRAQVAAKIERETARAKPAAKKPAKYRSQPIEVDGWRFDSKLEATRYVQLKARRARGEIRYFLRQVPFHLAPGSKYVVDFAVCLLDGTFDYEDTKGVDTPTSRTKRNLAEHLYGIKVRVLTRQDVKR